MYHAMLGSIAEDLSRLFKCTRLYFLEASNMDIPIMLLDFANLENK